MTMRVFLTGGSGLLGTKLAVELMRMCQVTAVGHTSPARNGHQRIMLDILDAGALAEALDGRGYTHVLHTAALRSPEECAGDVVRAYSVNTAGVENLAAACIRNGMKMVYVSTDYVFAGDKAPYREGDMPGPVNLYGRTKLAGEFAARSVPDHLVARIPALWGDDPEDARGNQRDFLAMFRRSEPFPVEHVLVRHYSLANDIAAAIAFCVELKMSGTVHLSARESQTKADFARALARMHGFDPALVVDSGLPAGAVARPRNPALDPSLYESLGGPRIRGMSEVVENMIRHG